MTDSKSKEQFAKCPQCDWRGLTAEHIAAHQAEVHVSSNQRLSTEQIHDLMKRHHFRHPLYSNLANLMQECYSLGRTAHETASKPVAWRHLVDSPYERHPRWHYTEEQPTEEPERFEALYVRAPVETTARPMTAEDVRQIFSPLPQSEAEALRDYGSSPAETSARRERTQDRFADLGVLPTEAPTLCTECGWEISRGSHAEDCSRCAVNGDC